MSARALNFLVNYLGQQKVSTYTKLKHISKINTELVRQL